MIDVLITSGGCDYHLRNNILFNIKLTKFEK